MGEMNHFCHEDHPLKLIDTLETIMLTGADGGSGDDKKVVYCYGCQKPISDGYAYGCFSCRYFLHKTCAQLEPTINHYFHPRHPLGIFDRRNQYWVCDVCSRDGLRDGFSYYCSLCNFDACMNCVLVAFDHDAAAAAIKEEAEVKFEHEGHPQHTLTLQLRPAAFLCDACKTDDRDLFYRCDSCDFWIHKKCASLSPTIDLPHYHKHPLLLIYSLPERFLNFPYYCSFCKALILQSHWMYHCANCRYFAHIKCALNKEQPSTPREVPDVEEQVNNHDYLHFPKSNAFTDPLKLLHFEKKDLYDHYTTEINHWSHQHPLILNVEPQGKIMPDIEYNDRIEVCFGCIRPLSLPYYSCKDGCPFVLHKYCAELPRRLEHQLHPDHLLDLVVFEDPESRAYECCGCNIFGNMFLYNCETCKFNLDVNCAFLPNTIKHESHKHPLVQLIDPMHSCEACGKWLCGISYSCKACKFHIDLHCAVTSPHSLAHRYCKGHQVQLTYPPVDDHPHDFYCDICEAEMNPQHWLYHCRKCDNSFHLHCLGRTDRFANFQLEGTISVPYHKHPITYVRRKKTPKYVCSNCNLDINGHLILECRSRICHFKICVSCHDLKKTQT